MKIIILITLAICYQESEAYPGYLQPPSFPGSGLFLANRDPSLENGGPIYKGDNDWSPISREKRSANNRNPNFWMNSGFDGGRYSSGFNGGRHSSGFNRGPYSTGYNSGRGYSNPRLYGPWGRGRGHQLDY
jgi:hypothetical protein